MLRSAGILGVPVDADGARRIAERLAGTPRIANRLLRRVRDFVEVRADGDITAEAAVAGLEVFGVDQLGLDKVDRSILDVLCRRFPGRPVGLTTLAQCVGEEPDTIEDAYEPYLLQQGLIQRTARGRVAAPRAWAHLGLTPVERHAALSAPHRRVRRRRRSDLHLGRPGTRRGGGLARMVAVSGRRGSAGTRLGRRRGRSVADGRLRLRPARWRRSPRVPPSRGLPPAC